MSFLIVLGLILLTGFIAAAAWMSRSSGGPSGEIPTAPASPGDEQPEIAVPKPTGPPPSGAADPLENMRAALNAMELDDLENMLEMGATLKPGVKELVQAEIRRRGQTN